MSERSEKKMETNEEKETDVLDEEIQLGPVGSFLVKKEFAGKDLGATIFSVTKSQFKGKLVLGVKLEGEPENKLVTIGSKNQTELVNLFGSKPRNWIGKSCVISFSKVTKFPIMRDGKDIDTEGVGIQFLEA